MNISPLIEKLFQPVEDSENPFTEVDLEELRGLFTNKSFGKLLTIIEMEINGKMAGLQNIDMSKEGEGPPRRIAKLQGEANGLYRLFDLIEEIIDHD